MRFSPEYLGIESLPAQGKNVNLTKSEQEFGVKYPNKGIEGLSFKEKIQHLESRGRDFDKYGNLLTSSKGARGRMQVMPGTSRDPGFGVTPARDDSPKELARVGRDYANALKDYYKGNERLAAMAYNWGQGNVDKWLANGADPSKVPGETANYVRAREGGLMTLAAGGVVAFDDGGPVHFVNGGLGTVSPPISATNPTGSTSTQVSQDFLVFVEDF